MPGLKYANQKRLNLRPQLESGESRKTGNRHGEAWLKKSWPELLDAHYGCDVPGPAVCLQDALHMITTSKVLITCPGAKKRKKDEQQDDEKPRTLSELEKHVIKEWYDAKDKEFLEKKGELYVTERNLSSAARARNSRAGSLAGMETFLTSVG